MKLEHIPGNILSDLEKKEDNTKPRKPLLGKTTGRNTVTALVAAGSLFYGLNQLRNVDFSFVGKDLVPVIASMLEDLKSKKNVVQEKKQKPTEVVIQEEEIENLLNELDSTSKRLSEIDRASLSEDMKKVWSSSMAIYSNEFSTHFRNFSYAYRNKKNDKLQESFLKLKEVSLVLKEMIEKMENDKVQSKH